MSIAQPVFCKVVEASYVKDYILHVKFNDETEGYVNLEPILHKEVFNPLKDVKKFANFYIDHGVISWNPDIDIAPEYLYTHLS